MADEFYFDTSIWLDFHEKRGRNGELALRLIIKIIEDDFKIDYSDLNVKEFKNLGYTNDNINSILSIAKPKNIKHAHIYREQIEEARKLARQRNIPKKDALHAVLARDNNLQLIATDPHFEQLKDITTAKKPEDFI
ncbi:MAG: PIN domain-containing protein [Nanoarchaeota archaeon]|nr:PIN domain-containing protein [Nanoarchaeota archaeon]MBU1005205.1 PIN domain-containing protein [Nanoarchaeota archaeon]MBU1946876.1 PIN domain-containing protein [Nanoarchaeota archaeon]